MSKLTSFLLLLLLPPAFGFAQKNFLDGGIIQHNGDTLKGQINYQEWDLNPSVIRFRLGTDASLREYDSRSISGFYVTAKQEFYRSAAVSLNREPSSTRDLPVFRSVREAMVGYRPVQDTVFLRVLALGRLNLFSFTDHLRRHYLAQPNGDSIRELVYRRVMLDRAGGLEILPLPEYRQQLAMLMASCPVPGSHFDKMAYQEKPLLEAFNSFNRCSNAFEYGKPEEKAGKILYILAGVAHPLCQIGGPYTNGATVSLPGGIVPVLGLGGDFNFSRSRGRRGVGLEVYGSHYSIAKASVEQGYDVNYHVEMGYVRAFAFFRQTLSVGKIQPYLKAAAGGSHYFKASYYYTKTIVLPDPVRHDRPVKQNDYCLAGAAGVRLGRLAIEARFEWGSNMALYDASDLTKTNLASLVVSYGLFP